MTEVIIGTLAREGEEFFKAWWLMLRYWKCTDVLWRRKKVPKYQVFRGQITYATILKKTGVLSNRKNFNNADARWQNISFAGYGSAKYWAPYQRNEDCPNWVQAYAPSLCICSLLHRPTVSNSIRSLKDLLSLKKGRFILLTFYVFLLPTTYLSVYCFNWLAQLFWTEHRGHSSAIRDEASPCHRHDLHGN